jgi:hypothetical protein
MYTRVSLYSLNINNHLYSFKPVDTYTHVTNKHEDTVVNKQICKHLHKSVYNLPICRAVHWLTVITPVLLNIVISTKKKGISTCRKLKISNTADAYTPEYRITDSF